MAKKRKEWLLQWAVLYYGLDTQLDTDTQLEAETPVGKVEEELRLEMDMQLSTTLLASSRQGGRAG